MKRSPHIQEELGQISPCVAAIPAIAVLQVPDDYFPLLAEKAMRNIHPGSARGHLPAGYFDGLAGSVLNRIAQEQDENLRMNGTVPVASPLEVPEGYFATLSNRIRIRVEEEKVLTPGGRLIGLRTRRVFRYAAAAALMLVVTLSVYRFVNLRPSTDASFENLDQTVQLGRQMDDRQFTDRLETLSEDDILSYLQQYGSLQDVARLGSGMEQGEIPSAEEFLSDEESLDKLLQAMPSATRQKN